MVVRPNEDFTMNRDEFMLATLWYPYLIPLVVFALFICLERMPRYFRRACLVIAAIIYITPYSWTESFFMRVSEENVVSLLISFGAISFIAISLIALSLSKLAKQYRRHIFVIISVLLLPPIIVPAGYAAITLNLGSAYFALDDLKSLPTLLTNVWQIHLISFVTVAVVSALTSMWLFKKPNYAIKRDRRETSTFK